KKLNEISPEYLGNIDFETIKTGEARAAVDEYVSSLRRKALEQAASIKMTELQAKKFDLLQEPLARGSSKITKFWEALGVPTTQIKDLKELNEFLHEGLVSGKFTPDRARRIREDYLSLIDVRNKEVSAIDEQIDAIEDYIQSQVLSNNADEDAIEVIDAKTEAIGRYTKALDISNLTPI